MFCIICGEEIIKVKHAAPIDVKLHLYACSVECKEEHKRRQNTLDELTQMSQEMGMYD